MLMIGKKVKTQSHFKWFFRQCIAASVLLLSFVSLVYGHGSALEKITRYTNMLKKEPNNAELYFKRGHVYEVNEHWDEALSDYRQGAKFNPKHPEIDLHLGRLFEVAGRPKRARKPIDRFLAKHPHNEEGLIVRSKVARATGDYVQAINDLDVAITYTYRTLPEWFIQKADLYMLINKPEDALESLAEGKQYLGDLITFQSKAIDIFVELKRYDDALSRVDVILAKLKRKDMWLAKKGDILVDAKRHKEARASYQETLKALDNLQPYLRKTPATVALAKSIKLKIANLPSK